MAQLVDPKVDLVADWDRLRHVYLLRQFLYLYKDVVLVLRAISLLFSLFDSFLQLVLISFKCFIVLFKHLDLSHHSLLLDCVLESF